jgi:threonine aldolase
MDTRAIDPIYANCTRFLSGHGPTTPRQLLLELAEATDPTLRSDHYGTGELIASFEAEVAALLGKPAAVFMPSGTMCQQIALRIWADRRASRHIALHPTCHLELHEADAYHLLHGLHGIRLGTPQRLLTLDDLIGVPERLGAALLELPQRELGGQLPPWDDLVAISAWAREQAIPLHLDGARLWESAPFYARPYHAIAALFDTVYVSFYKSLGGIAGAILAGPLDVVAEARVWQHRHGGRVVRLFPYVLSAQRALRLRLDRMAAYVAKARELGASLAAVPGLAIRPNPPHTNMLHLYLCGERERLEAALLASAQRERTWLFYPLHPTDLPGWQKVEIMVGDASLDVPVGDAVALIEDVLRQAGRSSAG